MHEHHTAQSTWELMAHGFCLLWDPWLVGGTVAADLVTWLAYLVIAGCLLLLRARTDEPTKALRWLSSDWGAKSFAAFIGLCGVSHLSSVLMIWRGLYWMHMGVLIATALVSVLVAVLVAIETTHALTKQA